MEKYTLFNGCDEWIVNFIDLTAFEDSLLMNILFQHRVLIHESYFFNSNLLAQHIKSSRDGLPLFIAAAQKGYIIPAIRDSKATTLREAYHTLDKANRDSNFTLVIDEIIPYKEQIITSVDSFLSSGKIAPFYWPDPINEKKTLGIEYLNIVRNFFQKDVPPHFEERSPERQQILLRIWEEKKWRYDIIEAAVNATAKNGNKGLQRMELLRLLGWELGLPKGMSTITITDINKYVTDDERKFRALMFIKWLAQCHHLAQSIIFETTLNFPVYNYSDDFLLDSLFLNKFDSKPTDINDDVSSLQVKTKLPPIEVLINSRPIELIAIREELGAGYLYALSRWEQDPCEKNRYEVEITLKSYCDAICKRYDSHLLPLMVGYERNIKEMSIKNPINEGLNVLQGLIPGGKYFFQFSKLIKITYKYIQNKKKKATVDNDLQIDVKNPELI